MHSNTSASPVAQTTHGRVVGFTRDGVHVFKGIRFGEAERFEPPIAAAPWRDGWQGDLDALTYGAQCPQLPGLLERSLGTGSLPSSEDCLFLNVFTPSVDGSRPVLVWIHGGAFTTGTAAMPWYDGASLVNRGDVVVVTVNYRLGALGFAGRSNVGSLDQIEALRWVHQHITAFGGDPGNVTVFGESAGGSSLLALMAMPAAEGLFGRAFAMSPSITQLRSGTAADEALDRYLSLAQAASLEELREAPLERIIDAQRQFLLDAKMGFTGFSPAGDAASLPDAILPRAAASSVSLTLGTTRDESALWNAFNPDLAELSDEALMAQLARRFDDPSTAADRYRAARPAADNVGILSAVMTDETFRRPAQRLAEARSDLGNATWMYWFTWASPAFGGRLGSCHAMDIPFAFDNLARKGVEAFTGGGADRQPVANAFSAAVLAVAKTGTPGWQPFDPATRATMRIDVDSELLPDPEADLRVLWP